MYGLFVTSFCVMNWARAPYQPSLSGQHHEEIGNLDYRLQLEIWKGNLAGALEMATASKQLTDWLVALSPLGNSLSFLKVIACDEGALIHRVF